MSREETFMRDKRYLGLKAPGADANGYEKWPRFCAEVPPELAEEIEREHRRALGVNADVATRAGAVRHGLRLYLDSVAPEPEAPIEGTAVEVIERPALERRAR